MKTMTWDGTEAGAQQIREVYWTHMRDGFLDCYIDSDGARKGKLVVESPLIDGELVVGKGGQVPVPG